MNVRLKAELAGASLVIPALVGLFSAGFPTLFCPFPLITTWPMLNLFPPEFPEMAIYLVVLIPALLFFLWNPGVLRGRSHLPKRTIAAAGLLSALTAFYFVSVKDFYLQDRGARYSLVLIIVNLAWLALLWSCIVRGLRRPSFGANLLTHWILFAWLGWYAFPWLGELP